MNQELAFAKKLEEIRKLAKEQGNMLSKEQVENTFAEIDISKEQLEPVFAYLKSKNIGTIDYFSSIAKTISDLFNLGYECEGVSLADIINNKEGYYAFL